MQARKPITQQQRPYAESLQAANGQPPAADQLWTADEANDHTDTLIDHASHIDRLLADTSLRWVAGYSGTRTWSLDENSVPVAYHAAIESTSEQRATTVPGSNSSVWTITGVAGDIDFTATYNAAKA